MQSHEVQEKIGAVHEGKEVLCRRGAVATGPAAAARVGAEIFRAGGNAMDAAAAASLACAVLEPESVDIGGYLFCAVVRPAGAGTVWSVDANAVAPRAAQPGMFDVLPAVAGRQGINETEYDCSVRDDANVYGPLAVAVPGFVAGVGTLWERWGRLQWSEIVAPAQHLADRGFPYGPTAAAIARRIDVLRRCQPAVDHLMPGGALPAADEMWHRRDLMITLARLSAHGWREFYDGGLGAEIARYVQSIGGVLSVEDMARYSPRVGPASGVTYRNHPVFAPGLPNGALTSLQILNLLECFPASIAAGTSNYWHRLGELMKLAWRDRLRSLGDPDFADVPADRLLDKGYAQALAEPLRRFPSSIDGRDLPPAQPSPRGTIHVSAADAEGNVVSATLSQGAPFGSCIVVPGTGVILGHGMCRLDPRPGRPNSIAAGKHPLNNAAPLIVSLPDRDVALGTRGGRPIVNVCAQLAHRIIDDGVTASQALAAPRLHVTDREPLEFLDFEFTEHVAQGIVDGLTAMGHTVRRYTEPVEGAGAAHCVELLTSERVVRASADTWAAGVD